jgi:hypothetical protein
MPEYSRKEFPRVFPHIASQKQQLVRKRLEQQFDVWEDQEIQSTWHCSYCVLQEEADFRVAWKSIVSPSTTSFLGVDWRDFLPAYQTYYGSSTVSFEILSVLQLCPIPPQVLRVIRSRNKGSLRSILYDQYKTYGVRIYDFGEKTTSCSIPFIDASAPLADDGFNQFGQFDLQSISHLNPDRTSSFRLVIFPQTRFSFIEDKVCSRATWTKSASLTNFRFFILYTHFRMNFPQ